MVMVGIVTALDGQPIAASEIAGQSIAGHDSFQNAQAFLDGGGSRGLQEQIILSGVWNLNPWFVQVEQVPMVQIPIGYVGVVISFVGKAHEDVSGVDFKHGDLVNIANLKGEDVDWQNSTISFTRKKTGVPVIVHLGAEALNLFKDLPAEGMLFPYLSQVRPGDRATEFGQRCRRLGITGVTLHSYRYAWAERAKIAGYPERFAQEALGHNSKAVHRAYAKRALMKISSLEEYEKNVA
jgi:hypothetical protein